MIVRGSSTPIEKTLWQQIIEVVKQQIPAASVDAWLSPLEPQLSSEKLLILYAPDSFFADFVQQNFARAIKKAVRQLGLEIEIKFASLKKTSSPEQVRAQKANLSPTFTFDSFITGISNEYARKWAGYVARRPDGSINPLFIYGKTGLGKTHLLHAIGNYIIKKFSDKNVYYLKSGKFVEMVVAAVQKKQISKLRESLRKIDVLLFDDFQDLNGKPFMQREFMNLMDDFITNQKQVVIASRYALNSIKWLSDALKSRLNAGMVVYISNPDFELKFQMVERTAEELDLSLSPEQIEFLARHLGNDNRQIRGAIARIAARKSFMDNEPLTIDLIRDLISDLIEAREIFVDDVLKSVSKSFRIPVQEIKGKTRRPSAVAARQAAALLMRKILQLSLKEIGLNLNRSHSTIVHAIKKAQKRLETDKTFRRMFKSAAERLKK